jgi:hypothetical protein
MLEERHFLGTVVCHGKVAWFECAKIRKYRRCVAAARQLLGYFEYKTIWQWLINTQNQFFGVFFLKNIGDNHSIGKPYIAFDDGIAVNPW